MARDNDILFMSEYIKNVLYFATVRPDTIFKSTADTHFFSIDDELVYENYYLDFGPLNLGCVYKYCKMLNEKLEKCLNNQIIVHYTSLDYKKRTNAAFLIGCFGVLYLSLPPKEALKPLIIPGHSYRPFQDATPCESVYTISILDCLQAINKAKDIRFFNFQDFNYQEYDRLDKLQGGDLNWIVPGKFLAFIGPVEGRSVLYHRPEEYIEYFKGNNVKHVIRLNKRLYDGNVFNNVDITHYDLFFPDGSCPPRNILLKFLQISENSDGAIAVHCKAGLGRTGSLIGCYLIKHYRMTSHEAIGWMRICRPGSVIGQQQEWLEQLEPWLIKQGNLYRRRKLGDVDKLPVHEYGLYSLKEKTCRQRPVMFCKSPSPPPPINRQPRNDFMPLIRPQASKTRGGENNEIENVETFLASCDLTIPASMSLYDINGPVIKNSTVLENWENLDNRSENSKWRQWKNIIFCWSCASFCKDILWKLSVRCVKYVPKCCNGANVWCDFLDKVASMVPNKNEEYNWRIRSPERVFCPRKNTEDHELKSRRSSGSGDPKHGRWCAQEYRFSPVSKRNCANFDEYLKVCGVYAPIPTFCTTQGPIVKTINEAKALLMRSTVYKGSQDGQLNSKCLTTKTINNKHNVHHEYIGLGNTSSNNLSSNNTVAKDQIHSRRRLGRSPSPSPHRTRPVAEQSRATNTPPFIVKMPRRDSKSAIRDALSRLKFYVKHLKKILTPPEMGALVSKALRPVKSFNIENRAHRVISKEKPTPAPQYESTLQDLKRTSELVPDIEEKLTKKDLALDNRLKNVYVTSHGRPEDDITRQKINENPDRPLPQDKTQVQDFDLGFKEPERIPYGRTTLRRALEFIESHQLNPEEVTAPKIAFEYKLKEEDVEVILKYFKTYEIYLPETQKSAAVFAGASTYRRQLQQTKVKELEDKSETLDKKETNLKQG